MKTRKILPCKKFDGKLYCPYEIAHYKQEAEASAKSIRAEGRLLARVSPWPGNVSTEEYGDGPWGLVFDPKWVIYTRARN